MQGMRDLMRTSLARSLRTLSPEDRLAAALPVVCGAVLASHCEVERMGEDGTLHLRVRDREWLPSLLSMREVLQGDLARTAGVRLSGLHFEVAEAAATGTRSRDAYRRPAEGMAGQALLRKPPFGRRAGGKYE